MPFSNFAKMGNFVHFDEISWKSSKLIIFAKTFKFCLHSFREHFRNIVQIISKTANSLRCHAHLLLYYTYFRRNFRATNIFAKTFGTTKIFFGVGGDLPSFSFSLTRMSFKPWISSFLDSFSPCNRGGAQEKQRQKQILSFPWNICGCMGLEIYEKSFLKI